MDVNGHIKILLFKHNCVIIPGFGGIVMQYAPATIHPTQHIFQPPRKALAFNKALTTNDGLLISQIANGNEMTYDQAETEVKKFVQMVETSLHQKGDYFIHDVGKFVKDVEGNIQFRADETVNFLLNSYGLDHFISSAIIRRDSYEPQIQTATLTGKKKKRFSWFGLLTIAIVFTFLFFQMLEVNNLVPAFNMPSASVLFDTNRTFTSFDKVNSAPVAPIAHRNDTVVQIIIIRDETAKEAVPSDSAMMAAATIAQEESNNRSVFIGECNTDITPAPGTFGFANKPVTVSEPEYASEYAPVQNKIETVITGNFMLVFYSTPDSVKAFEIKDKLVAQKIPVNVYRPAVHVYNVSKPGYATARDIVKDLANYRMKGFNNIYIQSTANNLY